MQYLEIFLEFLITEFLIPDMTPEPLVWGLQWWVFRLTSWPFLIVGRAHNLSQEQQAEGLK